MKILFHKTFDKRYRKLNLKLKQKVDATLLIFMTNPFDPVLKNHPLKGSLQGKKSFSVTSDVRVIFEEHEKYTVVLMLDVGTHNQVYGEN
ncbi:MAG: type II toxin-antitoxin system YafQ family toxin [Candidatus Gracilibacteria bacterium]